MLLALAACHGQRTTMSVSPVTMTQIMTPDNDLDTIHVAWFVDHHRTTPDATLVLRDGKLRDVRLSRASDAIDLGNVAIVPGLVNAHTHLEFSLLPKPIPTAGDFAEWIRSVVKYRRENPDIVSEALRTGILESTRHGTTLVGDITTSGWSISDYAESHFSGVLFQELIGLSEDRITSQLNSARSRLEANRSINHPLLGLSPHAPYTVHETLLRSSIDMARQFDVPVAMHLAETESELELLTDGTGCLRNLLEEFGLWKEGLFGIGQRPQWYLEKLAECPAALIVHGNYLNDRELQFIASRPQMTLVYCPRTHAAFGHPEHPWRRVLEWGGRVAIGTDSRASNPDLSIFSELQFLAKSHPGISHLELLKLATFHGRRALTGSGHDRDGLANLTAIRLSDPGFRDPHRDLFAPENQVVGTMIAGHWRFLEGHLPIP